MLNSIKNPKSKIQHPSSFQHRPKANFPFRLSNFTNPPFNIQNSPLGFSSPQSIIQNPKLKHPMICWKRTLRMGCEILNEQF
jgi:hypothetical protein